VEQLAAHSTPTLFFSLFQPSQHATRSELPLPPLALDAQPIPSAPAAGAAAAEAAAAVQAAPAAALPHFQLT